MVASPQATFGGRTLITSFDYGSYRISSVGQKPSNQVIANETVLFYSANVLTSCMIKRALGVTSKFFF